MKTKTRIYILVFLVVVLGLFLRTINIDHAPPGVYPDEAVNGIDAQTANDTSHYQWFYEANNGREGLFMNLIAFCFKLFGISFLTLKLPSVIFGTLTILGTFLLTKELFQKDRMGLISAFLVATAFWAINFSRISFRANMLPTVLVFSFYFLMRGMRTKKITDFILSGSIFGLGLHTYIAFRIAPAILAVMFVTFLFTRKNFLKEYWKQILVFVLFIAIFAAPMLYTFYLHPEYIQSRTGSISVLNPEVNNGHLFKALFKTISLSVLKYNIWGDQNWRHNYPPYPILDPLTGVLFTLGLIYAVLRFFHLLYLRFMKKEGHLRLEVYILLLSWFVIMMAAEFMSYEGNPHALRSIGTLPVVFILASLSIEFFLRKVEKHSHTFNLIMTFLIALMVFSIGSFNSLKYHYAWANKTETAQSFDQNLMEIAAYLKTLPPDQEKFVVAECMQRIPIQLFNWKMPNIEYFYAGQIDGLNPKDKNNFVIILTDKDDQLINNLISRFPNLTLEEMKDRFGLSYYILK